MRFQLHAYTVTPAQAGAQARTLRNWAPACAGVTARVCVVTA